MGTTFYQAEVFSLLFGWESIRDEYGSRLTNTSIDRLKEEMKELKESNVVEEWTI